MRSFFVRPDPLKSLLLLFSFMMAASLSCDRADKSAQPYHDHLAYKIIHDIPDPVHIDPSRIKTARDIDQDRKVFIANFLPLIHAANKNILKQRELIEEIQDDVREKGVLDLKSLTILNTMLAYYQLSAIDSAANHKQGILTSIDSLLPKIDIIPEKLVMAQAIVESGWGTSRFSRLANNYFGVKCYSRGCGIKPLGDFKGHFEVKKYPGRLDAIRDYLHIINSGFAFAGLRSMRAVARKKGQSPDPFALAEALGNYAEEGNTYIDLVKEVMQYYIPENPDKLFGKQ